MKPATNGTGRKESGKRSLGELLFGPSFRHGVHPPDSKALTAGVPIRRMPFPDEIVLPLRQNAGKPARAIVRVGDRVERGDVLGVADGYVSVPIHAPAAGRVSRIGWWPHPDGSMDRAITLTVDRFSPQLPRPRIVPEWEGLTAGEVRAAVQAAGVVGLGGAAFPTHVKLNPPGATTIELLLINGAECEPYLTSDHRVMVEHPDRVHFGIRIMMQCLGVDRAVIGVEKNKPDAIERLRTTVPADLDIEVIGLTVKYPQGAEKMLIRAVTGREVPSGKLPMHVGTVVQNVGSIAAIAEVFETGYPLIERIVTVTGPGIRRPRNLVVPVGTKLRDVIEFCGGVTDDATEIIFGGPMMGLPQANLDVPIIKGTGGVVVLTERESARPVPAPCIHCGRCLDACPVFLDPQSLGQLAQLGRYEEMEEQNLMDCMLCGSCSYVCPSNIPLSQMFSLARGGLRRRKQRAEREAEERAARDAVETAEAVEAPGSMAQSRSEVVPA
ncbi:MAG TPA: electron transport complex subunit RsxC [Longimicrobiales bacterium]|nr:electron transport complex subunit RsxC [Longimicrobiales bacterium]